MMTDTQYTEDELAEIDRNNEARRVANLAAQEELDARESAAQKAKLAEDREMVEDAIVLTKEQICFDQAGLTAPLSMAEARDRYPELRARHAELINEKNLRNSRT